MYEANHGMVDIILPSSVTILWRQEATIDLPFFFMQNRIENR